MFKKYIIRIAAFLAFAGLFVGSVYGVSIIFTPKTEVGRSGDYSKITFAYRTEQEQSLDLFIVGDSNAYRAVSPMELWREHGIVSCVSGRGMQTAKGTRKILEELYEKQSPKLVLLETDMLFSGKNEDVLKQINRSGDVGLLIKRVFLSGPEQFDDIATSSIGYYFPVVKYHSRLWEITSRDFSPIQTYRSEYHGFVPSTDVEAYTGDFAHMTPKGKIKKMSPRAESELLKIAQLCKERGSELVLFTAPSPLGWNGDKHAVTAAFAEKNGLEYVDLNDAGAVPGLDWTKDTKDAGDHMNLSGAKKVTAALYDKIIADYGFEDKRGDTGFSWWNNDLAVYDSFGE